MADLAMGFLGARRVATDTTRGRSAGRRRTPLVRHLAPHAIVRIALVRAGVECG